VMRSRSVSQLSSVIMIFKEGTDLMRARLLVQERITAVTPSLPRWASSPFMIQPLSSTSRVMKIGMSTADRSTSSLIDMSLIAYWTVRPRLMRVPGVANVAIWGDRWSTKQVLADPNLLREHNVTLQQVLEASADAVDVGMLKFSSGHEIGTGGCIDTPNQRLQVRHELPALTEQELAQIPLGVGPPSKPLVLGDVARIVEKLPWGNTLEVTRGVEAALAAMALGLSGISNARRARRSGVTSCSAVRASGSPRSS